jgi:hypothetical protein
MVVVPARKATQPGEIGPLESILGLLRSLKIRALDTTATNQADLCRKPKQTWIT